MPSIMKGDWRSFGTIQAKIWTQPASQLPHSQTSARTRLPHDSAMVDVWLTDVRELAAIELQLMFALACSAIGSARSDGL